MTEQLDGTVALVTGASSGIGAATAKGLAVAGAAVAAVARRLDRLDTVVNNAGVMLLGAGGRGTGRRVGPHDRRQPAGQPGRAAAPGAGRGGLARRVADMVNISSTAGRVNELLVRAGEQTW